MHRAFSFTPDELDYLRKYADLSPASKQIINGMIAGMYESDRARRVTNRGKQLPHFGNVIPFQPPR